MIFTLTLVDMESLDILTSTSNFDSLAEAYQAVEFWHTIPGIYAQLTVEA